MWATRVLGILCLGCGFKSSSNHISGFKNALKAKVFEKPRQSYLADVWIV